MTALLILFGFLAVIGAFAFGYWNGWAAGRDHAERNLAERNLAVLVKATVR